ncbi:hypothetical protein DMNBHIDG_02073 [Candidatus Methanoperedenaceae archaeon GB37]|nr:hypothetical protein DMNBHIDG_02073 [Candidatus Methanoperedenaceae archaeon GB37]
MICLIYLLFLLDYELMVKAVRGEIGELMSEVKKTFEVIAPRKDMVIIGGSETVWQGNFSRDFWNRHNKGIKCSAYPC